VPDALPPTPSLGLFADSGVIHYHDQEADITLGVRCGPFPSRTAYARADGPCDRLGIVPGDGHFIVASGTHVLLNTPDCGYRLDARVRSCMLVDGKGQWGDIGYPMSIPSWNHRGQGIDAWDWDNDAGAGWVRLNLGPAYPDDVGMTSYTREFVFAEGRHILVRDCVTLATPRHLSWLFQALEEDGISLADGLCCCIGASPCLHLQANSSECGLTPSVVETPVVWSYSSSHHFKPFVHVRYDTVDPVAAATVEFAITWDE